MTDDQLSDGLYNGNRIAFEMAYRRYYSELCDYATCHTNLNAAEDIVQQTFLELARCKVRIRRLRPFLYRHTAYRVVDWLRDQTKRKTTAVTPYISRVAKIKDGNDDPEEFPDYNPLESVSDTKNLGPDKIASQMENIQTVKDALDHLLPAERAAILAIYFENLTFDEAAKSLGISGNAVRLRVSRALKRLRKILVF